MNQTYRYILTGVFLLAATAFQLSASSAEATFGLAAQLLPVEQTPDTTVKIPYPIPVDDGSPNYQIDNDSPLYLSDPPNIKREIIYDPVTRQYNFVSTVGGFSYRTPTPMSQDEYMEYQNRKGVKKYWNQRSS
ncbi:MAG: hypothetical protein K8F24_03355, partial [Bacteroidales bacterium]|nr:hypothetical protein [Bacteroidales bacterium]